MTTVAAVVSLTPGIVGSIVTFFIRSVVPTANAPKILTSRSGKMFNGLLYLLR